MTPIIPTNTLQNILRILLGTFMAFAAIAHMTFERVSFKAQVPDWVPMDKDTVVILSGVVELALGLAVVLLASLLGLLEPTVM